MNHYFNVEATSPSNVSYSYCGDDRCCSLPQRLPSEERALGSIRLPASMSRDGIEGFLYQAFTSLATANPGHRILVRWAEDNTVTAWMFPLRQPGKRTRRCSGPRPTKSVSRRRSAKGRGR